MQISWFLSFIFPIRAWKVSINDKVWPTRFQSSDQVSSWMTELEQAEMRCVCASVCACVRTTVVDVRIVTTVANVYMWAQCGCVDVARLSLRHHQKGPARRVCLVVLSVTNHRREDLRTHHTHAHKRLWLGHARDHMTRIHVQGQTSDGVAILCVRARDWMTSMDENSNHSRSAYENVWCLLFIVGHKMKMEQSVHHSSPSCANQWES